MASTNFISMVCLSTVQLLFVKEVHFEVEIEAASYNKLLEKVFRDKIVRYVSNNESCNSSTST